MTWVTGATRATVRTETLLNGKDSAKMQIIVWTELQLTFKKTPEHFYQRKSTLFTRRILLRKRSLVEGKSWIEVSWLKWRLMKCWKLRNGRKQVGVHALPLARLGQVMFTSCQKYAPLFITGNNIANIFYWSINRLAMYEKLKKIIIVFDFICLFLFWGF